MFHRRPGSGQGRPFPPANLFFLVDTLLCCPTRPAGAPTPFSVSRWCRRRKERKRSNAVRTGTWFRHVVPRADRSYQRINWSVHKFTNGHHGTHTARRPRRHRETDHEDQAQRPYTLAAKDTHHITMEVSPENFERFSYRQLQKMAKSRGLNAGGKKQDILGRLQEQVHDTDRHRWHSQGARLDRCTVESAPRPGICCGVSQARPVAGKRC